MTWMFVIVYINSMDETEFDKLKKKIGNAMFNDSHIEEYEQIISQLFKRKGVKYGTDSLKGFLCGLEFSLVVLMKDNKERAIDVLSIANICTDKAIRDRNEEFLSNLKVKDK